jgi:hypothetical protein
VGALEAGLDIRFFFAYLGEVDPEVQDPIESARNERKES